MSQLTRRGMFTAVAGATAGAALTVPAAAFASTPAPAPVTSHDAIVARARAAARPTTPLPQPAAITARARVALCRAWDHQVYLIIDDEVHGFATVDPRTFAIVVAAQLVGQPIAVQYWGHRPGSDGIGAFEGVLVAADERDLPRGGSSWR
ncbi:MAG: hypothetical protein SFX73_32775 [Kofleriaceae bacterium]|nr:hypothetical protein [Kofleriaceae bacterium]